MSSDSESKFPPHPPTESESSQTTAEDTMFGVNRREFMVGAAVFGAIASIPVIAKALPPHDETPSPPETAAVLPARKIKAHFKVNGQAYDVDIDPRETVLDLLRERLELTGTKKGCDHGQCGACTVIIDGKRVNSCLSLAAQNQKKDILTIEGLAKGGELHPVQEAFIKHDAFQCGFCTPGQIMSAVALMKEPCGGSEMDVRECMSGNICRCGAYRNILSAIQEVRSANAPSAKGSHHAAV